MDSSAYKIEYREAAEENLHKTYEHIAKTLKNPRAADQIQNAIFDALDYLIKDPEIYPLIGDSSYRKCIVENYIAIYFVDHKKKTVYVDEVVCSLQNYLPKWRLPL